MKNSKEDEFLEFSLELLEFVDNFLDDYFTDVRAVIDFNNRFFKKNGFEFKTEIDYIRLDRFVSVAYHTILANNPKIIDTLIQKFYKDLVSLNDFYLDFTKKITEVEQVYKFQFLPYYRGIESIARRLSRSKMDFTLKENVKKLDEYLQKQFVEEFEKFFKVYKNNLRNIINTKHYYFDHLLWHEAKKSHTMREFFKKSIGDDIDIEATLSTKTFIKQYLKSIDDTNTRDEEWHDYLREVIQVMD